MIKTKLDTSFKIATYTEPEATGKNVRIVFSQNHIYGEEPVLTGGYRYVMLYITDHSSHSFKRMLGNMNLLGMTCIVDNIRLT